MEFGIHLPLIDLDGSPWSLSRLTDYTRQAEQLGFTTVTANDHLVYGRPWLDGPTALAAVLPYVGRMALATSVALPVIRGPLPVAKAMAALDILSNGRMIVGLGPGSSPRDYATVGIPFAERWRRFDEAVQAVRALLRGDGGPFTGKYYSLDGIQAEPRPVQQPTPPIWIGSWGSDAGLQRVARLGDGWLASAYNTSPLQFGEAWRRLREHVVGFGKDPALFPNALATMFFHVTDDEARISHIANDLLAPFLGRPADELRQRLLIGSARECIERLSAYQEAGLQRVFLWPIGDEVEQITSFHQQVARFMSR